MGSSNDAENDSARTISELQKLKTQFDFERLISNISARFVNISLERVHEEIESALLQLLQFFRLDRCRLMRIVRDGNAARVTHVHSAEGIVPLPHIVTYSELFPWHVKKNSGRRNDCHQHSGPSSGSRRRPPKPGKNGDRLKPGGPSGSSRIEEFRTHSKHSRHAANMARGNNLSCPPVGGDIYKRACSEIC